MSITTVAFSLLLQAATPAASPSPEGISWSWCAADAATPAGRLHYLSDPFVGETDVYVENAFREYVQRSYPRAKGATLTVSCRLFPSFPVADAALKTEAKPRSGVTTVTTAWRFHFE